MTDTLCADRGKIMPRSVLVTGAGKRIGRTVAEALAADGWAVALHYRGSREAAENLAGAIRVNGGKAVTIAADLGDETQVQAMVPAACAALAEVGAPPLGALINNASVFEYDSALSATRESWDLHMEANLRAPFVLTQAFARALPENARGCVVNIIDQRVWNLTPHFTSYTLSKAGLWALTQTLALALAPRIRVNAVGPGPTLPSPRQSPDRFADQCAAMPLRQGSNPAEIADAVRFLLAAPAVTGQMIALDGGQHLGWLPPGEDDGPEE